MKSNYDSFIDMHGNVCQPKVVWKSNQPKKRCPMCGETTGQCPECGKQFEHGTLANCPDHNPDMNVPIDCLCGFVVSEDLEGVLDYEMKLHKWE